MVIVQCTWKVPDARQISDAVSWSEGNDNLDVEDEVKPENCLLLEAPDSSSGYLTIPACQLLLSCQPPHQIHQISVLSEARVLEVYGHHGEYLKTVRNELLEIIDDMAVFRGDIPFERPLTVCSLKFNCLRSKTDMWLYGVKVNLQKIDSEVNLPRISLAEVERRIHAMGLKLSNKAEAFKQMVEKYQSSPTYNQQDLGPLITMLQMANLIERHAGEIRTPSNGSASPVLNKMEATTSSIPDSSTPKHELLSKSPKSASPLQNFKVPLLLEANKNQVLHTEKSTSPFPAEKLSEYVQTEEAPPGLEERLISYIDKRLQDINKHLWERIQETEQKLLCKLDEIESFVKPQGLSR